MYLESAVYRLVAEPETSNCVRKLCQTSLMGLRSLTGTDALLRNPLWRRLTGAKKPDQTRRFQYSPAW